MSQQFDICLIKNDRAGSTRVMILQHNRFEHLKTRIVVPLLPETSGVPLGKINPVVLLDGEKWVLAFDQLATISTSHIGSVIASAKDQQSEFISAIDMMFVGY